MKLDEAVVVITGSRGWTEPDVIRERLDEMSRDTIIAHGGARGADQISGRVAVALGFHVAVIAAQWGRHGKDAGRRRNRALLRLNPRLVLAFWDGKSPGTGMMIRLANEENVPVEVVYRQSVIPGL